jgi:hypothetical protein
MKFASLEHFEIRVWKIALFGIAVASAACLATSFAIGGVLGQAKGAVLIVEGALVFYITVSTPRRLMDGRRVSEARESVLFSAAAKACLNVSGSRARTLVTLRPRDPGLAQAVEAATKKVLLGTKVEDAIEESAEKLVSYSAAAELRSVASLRSTAFDAGDEETRGLENMSGLDRETKIPMFMTACFFAPIMMLLYALFTHSYDPGSLTDLTALEFIILDLAFYLSATDRAPQ